MKRTLYLLVILFTVCVVIWLPVSASDEISEVVDTEQGATDIHIEAEESEIQTLSDDIPDGIENAEKSQLIEIINGLSGEGIEKMQGILLAGINSVERDSGTVWDRTADFCERHIEAISLLTFAVTVIFYMALRVRGNKRLRRNIEISTNNAVEAVEIAKGISADNVAELERYSAQVEHYAAAMADATERIDVLLAEIRQKSLENEALRNVIRHNSEADMLVADTVNELLQLSNIPQNKKDAIYSKVSAAKVLISSEGNYEE